MLMPKRVKFRKSQRGKMKGNATRGARVSFGDLGLKAIEPAWITSRQIEACRVAITRKMKRDGRVWIRIFPDKPYTKKPPEVTMGSGKGDVDHFVASVTPGRVLFEIDGLSRDESLEVLRTVASKLSVKTKVVSKTV